MVSWHELWARKRRADQLANEADSALANHLDELETPVIEDLRDPRGKRLLFDDFEGTAQQSTQAREAIPAAYLVPSVRNQQSWGRVRLRACLPGCACLCARCAWIRERERGRPYAHVPT
jgi:hypothetical protein